MKDARLRTETVYDPESGTSVILSTKVLAGVPSDLHSVSFLPDPNSENAINIMINEQSLADKLKHMVYALAIGSVAAGGFISWIYNLEMLARTSK